MKLFAVHGYHNGLYAFSSRGTEARCVGCGDVLDKWNPVSLRVKVPKSNKFDISMTYDGVTVVSARFVDVYVDNGLCGLQFVGLDHGFSALVASRRVAFDSVTRRTEFSGKCEICGTFEEVIGATPAYLKPPVDVGQTEFVWTDLEFASNDQKRPLLICGEHAGSVLVRSKFRGLDTLSPVRGLDP